MTKDRVCPQSFRVLFFDSFSYRHSKFRITAKDQNKWFIHQYHAHNGKDFLNHLAHDWKWDVIFFPSYISGKDKETREELVQATCSLRKLQRPNLIIFHGMLDEHGVIDTFRAAGFCVAHRPYWDNQLISTKGEH